MKKNLLILLSFITILLTWCINTDNTITKINPEEWNSEKWSPIETAFNDQIEETQYIKDLKDFLSYNILLITEDKPYKTNLSINANFDENSAIKWWLEFSEKKVSKSHDYEVSDMDINLDTSELKDGKVEPLIVSWNISLLYKDNEMYAKLHNFGVSMWEWNMYAKMYTLMGDLLNDNWINLEVNDWWVFSVDTEEDNRLPYIMWTITNVLKTEDIYDSPNFLNSVAELLEIINSYSNLWISTNGLTLKSAEAPIYYELWDWSIQKEFSASFEWENSSFDLWFISSKKWLELHISNIKGSDKSVSEFIITLTENKKSTYSVQIQYIKDQQKIIDIDWEIKYSNTVDFSANFNLEIQTNQLQIISWKLNWNVTKKSWDWEIPELTGNVFLLSELLSSL